MQGGEGSLFGGGIGCGRGEVEDLLGEGQVGIGEVLWLSHLGGRSLDWVQCVEEGGWGGRRAGDGEMAMFLEILEPRSDDLPVAEFGSCEMRALPALANKLRYRLRPSSLSPPS